jgi:predicted GIY-YIG superfamily endonuclease
MSDIVPTEAELKAAKELNIHSHDATPYCGRCVSVARRIATHTRYEGKTAEEWKRVLNGALIEWTEMQFKLQSAEEKAERYRLASLKADARIAELETAPRQVRLNDQARPLGEAAGSAFVETRLPDGGYQWRRELPTRCTITMRGANSEQLKVIRKYTKTRPNAEPSRREPKAACGGKDT